MFVKIMVKNGNGRPLQKINFLSKGKGAWYMVQACEARLAGKLLSVDSQWLKKRMRIKGLLAVADEDEDQDESEDSLGWSHL